jgi:hypothetical protein
MSSTVATGLNSNWSRSAAMARSLKVVARASGSPIVAISFGSAAASLDATGASLLKS